MQSPRSTEQTLATWGAPPPSLTPALPFLELLRCGAFLLPHTPTQDLCICCPDPCLDAQSPGHLYGSLSATVKYSFITENFSDYPMNWLLPSALFSLPASPHTVPFTAMSLHLEQYT